MILGVPTLHRYDLLGRLIASAEAGSCKPSAYLIVDNGGKFGALAPAMPAVASALARWAEIDVLAPGRNLGVAASWNALLDRAGAEPIAISNDDVELGEDALEALARAIGVHDFVIAEGPPNANGWCLFAQTARCTELVGGYCGIAGAGSATGGPWRTSARPRASTPVTGSSCDTGSPPMNCPSATPPSARTLSRSYASTSK